MQQRNFLLLRETITILKDSNPLRYAMVDVPTFSLNCNYAYIKDVGGFSYNKETKELSNLIAYKGKGKELLNIAKKYYSEFNVCFFNGFLTKFYVNNSLTITDTCTFDDELAPTDWNYDKLGRPLVMFAEYKRG